MPDIKMQTNFSPWT